ncbi:hypothetical protein ACHAP3_006403 [Botrytis cinerea]
MKDLLRFNNSEMVDIHVGEDEDSGHFKLHKSILCDKVPYFENMFNGNFIEGTTNSASLPEDDPEVFNMLVSPTALHLLQNIHPLADDSTSAMN